MLELDEMLAIARKSPPDDGGLSLDVMLDIARAGGDAPPEEMERMAAIFQPPEDLLLRDPAGLGMEPWRVQGENGERINAPLPGGMLPPDPTKANAGLLTEPPKRFSYSVAGTPWERTLPQASWLDRFLNVGMANQYEREASDAARLYNDAINNLNQGASLDPMQIHAELESDPTLFMVPPENLSNEILKRRAQRAKQDMDRNIDKARRWQPTEYARPEGWFQETAAEMLENALYSFRHIPLSAAATMALGPGGAFLGAMPGALGEGRDEGNEVYWRLIAKGVPHEEALRQSDAHARWVTSGLMLSDPLQNIATFGAKKLFPNAGGVTRGLGATLFDMFSEGAEEFLENVGGDLSVGDPVNWEDAWRAGKFGALNGGLMGAGSSATGAAYNAIAQNAQINAVNDVLDTIREQQRQQQVQQKKADLRENLHNTIEQDRADRKQQAELERIPQTMEKLEAEIEKARKNGDAGRMEALLRYRAWLAERQGAIQSQKSARAEEIQRQDAAEAGQMEVPSAPLRPAATSTLQGTGPSEGEAETISEAETPPQPLETPPQSSAEPMTAPPQGEPETQVQAEGEPETQTVREAIKRRIMEMQHEQYGEEEAEANAAVAEAFANYVAEATGRTPEDVMREMNPQFVNDPEGRGMYQQPPMNPGVDVSTTFEVEPMDLTREIPDRHTLMSKLRALVKSGAMISRDKLGAISVGSGRKIRHVIQSSQNLGKMSNEAQKVRQRSLLTIDELIPQAVLVESAPNMELTKKPDITAYHRFYVPVATEDGKYYKIRIVAEEVKGTKNIRPIGVTLYDLTLDGKSTSQRRLPSPQDGTRIVGATGKFEISLQDFLKGVNDSEGKPYLDINGDPAPPNAWQQARYEDWLRSNQAKTYKQSIGERGAAALDKTDAGRRIEDLNVAREMEKAGKDAKAIRLATGWERGADGKWRFEILDGEFSRRGFSTDPDIREYLEIIKKSRESGLTNEEKKRRDVLWGEIIRDEDKKAAMTPSTLKDFYNAPDLYAAYPELGDLSVDIDPDLTEADGGYNPKTRTIRLASRLTDEKMAKILIHEIQHAVQHIEGFAKGGNVEGFVTNYHQRRKDAVRAVQISLNNLGFSKDMRALFPYFTPETEEPGKLLDLAKIWVQGSVPENERASLIKDIEAAEKELLRIDGENLTPTEAYRRLGGEVEARNASTRMDMTAEERRTSLLADTEDVAREDQIILREALGVAESRETEGANNAPRGYTRFEPEITDEAGNIIQDTRTVIGILKNGDKSSIPHELGHVFLEMMRRMSQMENVSEQARADWKTIVDWLRLRDIDFSQELSEQDATRWRNAHEKWSAGFEKYLASGKAPNSRLKAVFEAFKRWMKEIYQKIRNITWTDADGKEHRFDLSKDVREVMDRMMGGAETEAQSRTKAGTRAETGTEQESTTMALEIEKDAGPETGESFEVSEEWDYPELSEDATEAVDGWLDDWERHDIESGIREHTQGITKVIRYNGGLRMGELAHRMGRERAGDIRNKWPGLFRNTTGHAPLTLDVMAQQLQAAGYQIDEEGIISLLQDEVNQRPVRPAPLIEVDVDTLNALIDRLGVEGARKYLSERGQYLKGLQKRIQERYDADKSNAGAKADLEAAYREQREIAESVKALDRIKNAPNPDADIAEGKPDAKPEDREKKQKPRPKQEQNLTLYEAMKRGYQMAEKYTKEAFRAGKRAGREAATTKLRAEFRDRMGAVREKGRERLAKQKNRLKEFYHNWVRRLRDQKKERAEAERQKGRDRIEALKERISERDKNRQETRKILNNIKHMARDERVSWAKQREIAALLGEKNIRKVKKELGLDGLRELRDEIHELHKQGREEFARWEAERRQRIDEKHAELRASLDKKTVGKPQATRGREDRGKQYKGLRGKAAKVKDVAYAATMDRTRFFDWLDGGRTEHDGAFVKHFVDGLNDAYAAERRNVQKRQAWMQEELKKLGFKNLREFTREIAKIDGVSYTCDQVMEIYMGMKNEKKAAAILYGNFVNEGKYTVEEAQSVINQLIGKLSEKHKKAAELVAKDHELNFERINNALIAATNRGMEHETDYTSIHRLEHQSSMGLIDANDEAALRDGMTRGAVLRRTEDGFMQRRVTISPQHQSAVQLGLFSNWMSDIARHEHAAAMMGPAGELASALLQKDPDGQTLGKMVKERYGAAAWQSLASFFNDSVDSDSVVARSVLDGMYGALARNMIVSYLWGNLSTMAKQTASFPRFLIGAGPHRMLASVGRFLTNPRKFLDRVYEMSPRIADRRGDEMVSALRQDPVLGSRKYQHMIDAGLEPIGWVDRAVCSIGWDAVYHANFASLGHEGAVREADRIVSLTQPLSGARDKSRAWREHGAIRLLSMFTADAAQTWGMTAYDLAQQLGSGTWNGTKKGFLTMAVLAITAVWIKGISDAMSGRGDDDDDDDERSFVGDALTEQTLLSFPVIGKELLAKYEEGTGKYRGGRPSPVAAPFTKFMNAVSLWASGDEEKQDRALREGTEALSLLALPMPVTAMRRLFRMLNGDDE